MNNSYTKIITSNDVEKNDIIIAMLSELPFETFEENQDGVSGYLKTNDLVESVENELIIISKKFNFTFSKEEIEYQNWNKIWESNFQPIIIDDFCGIRADFHEPLQLVKYEIVINPKMAFGTGHHETTFMMIQAMQNIDFRQKKVFDFGCGTGVLAILAARLGAIESIGVDNEFPAYESTIENAEINKVPIVKSIFGTLDAVKQTDFDVILANINRNIIVNSLYTLYQKLNKNGYILMSGFLKEDETFMTDNVEQIGLKILGIEQRGNWICIKAQKTT